MVNFIKYFIFSLLFDSINSYDLCVVGGSSGLGREIIYQGLIKKNKILALTNNPSNIKVPYRGGGLKYQPTIDLIKNPDLIIDNYNNYNKYNYKNIVFTTGAKPFKVDYSDSITRQILSNRELQLDNIILISAYGVGDSIQNLNLGIQVMNNWYLQDVYRAKNIQEKIIGDYGVKFNTNITIFRPKGLSYGINAYSITSRETLAKEILEIL